MKTVLIVGGSRGIGAAAVEAMRTEGWRVEFTSTSGADDSIAADIRDAESVAAAFAEAERRLGGLDRVVVGASINVPPSPLAGFDDDSFRVLDVITIDGSFNTYK